MIKRQFHMRLKCVYESEKNTIARLEVEREVGRVWEAFELSVLTGGFDVFVYALLNCQHTYFRNNCAERDLVLSSAEGSINVSTDMDWKLLDVQADFTGRLASGLASQDDIEFIQSRMRHCPVSRNVIIPDCAESKVSLVTKREQAQRRRDPAAVT